MENFAISVNDKRVKYGCYSANVAMAVVGNLSPLLFLIFEGAYGISFSLLGMLVLINFCTQLGIDLAFSFFSHKFNIPKVIKCMPILTIIGLAVYALLPYFFPAQAYVGLAIGTVIFSASSGLAEVLVSPVVAAIPAKDPDSEMSKLHSIYAWGVVGVVVFGTLFLFLFGSGAWVWLPLIFALIPVATCCLFAGVKIPQLEKPEKTSGALQFLKNKGVWLCVFAIFLGGASEVVMAQWSSAYLEQSFGIPKVWGDIFGVAIFSVALGLGRSLYAKIGKNIGRALFMGATGAAVCYLCTVCFSNPIIGLAACALTGFCVSMLWPGSLIVASDRFPQGGVLIFALMAAGGDFGAAIGPQLVGVVTDVALHSSAMASWASALGLTIEQLSMKAGMLVGAIFPIIAAFVFFAILRLRKKDGWQGLRKNANEVTEIE